MERRWAKRVDVDLPVRLELRDGRHESGRMRNASISGALIECAVELPVFTPLAVFITEGRIRLPEPVRLAARVVRSEHPCVGVEWRDLASQELVDLLHGSNGGAQR